MASENKKTTVGTQMNLKSYATRLKNQTPAKDASDEQIDPAVLMALKQQETSMREMMKQVVKETVQEVLSGEFKQMKEMIEMSLSAVEHLTKDVKAQAEVSDTLKQQQKATATSLNAVKETLADCGGEVKRLRERLINQEDRARRLNLRLVNLPEGAEGSDPIGFLQENLCQWFPALMGRKIEIQRAHRIYGSRSSGRPRTLIFCLLRYGDRMKILREARALKSPPSHAKSNLYFFADYSPETTSRRKAFDSVKKQLYAKGYHPFLVYPAILKVREDGGDTHEFHSPSDAEIFLAGAQNADKETPGRNNSFNALTDAESDHTR